MGQKIRTWQEDAAELAQIIDALRQEKAAFIEQLESMYAVLRGRKDVIIPKSDGTWFYFKRTGEDDLRMFIVTKPENPQYYFEQIALEHFLVSFDPAGKFIEIKEVDAQGMKRDGKSGYHSEYTSTTRESELIGAKLVPGKIRPYLEAFGARATEQTVR